MPLSAELEKLLGLITDPVEREARKKDLTELSENGLRQADYSRKMNEVTTTKAGYDAQHAKNREWFYGDPNKGIIGAKDQFEKAQADLRTANERVAALETVHESGLETPAEEAEVNKQLAAARKEMEVANKKLEGLSGAVESVNTMIKEGKLITPEKFEEEINKRGDALGAALLDIIDLQNKHRQEFGTDLDRKVLIEEAHKRGGNLVQAYEEVTKEARAVKLRKDIEAEVEAKYKEKLRTQNIPYVEGGEPVIGPLQQRLQKKGTGIPDEVEADGSGRLGNLIGQELRQEGKV